MEKQTIMCFQCAEIARDILVLVLVLVLVCLSSRNSSLVRPPPSLSRLPLLTIIKSESARSQGELDSSSLSQFLQHQALPSTAQHFRNAFNLPSTPPPTNASPQLITTTMPTYGPLRTTVSLYMWEADACQDISGLGDASSGCEVERIKEDSFDNTSLDFLGPGSVPYYLVNAGQDLFSPAPAPAHDVAITPANKVGCVGPTTTPGSVEYAGPVIRSPSRSPPTNESTEPDHDSSLSSLDSSMFETSPQGVGSGSIVGVATGSSASLIILIPKFLANNPNTADPLSSTKKMPSQYRRLFAPPILVKKAIRKPITSPKALKLQIDLSKESFMHSIVTNNPEDICISVLYNGEFVYSRVFRWNTFNSGQKTEGGHPAISGRRVGTTVEVPWIINPMSQNAPADFVSHSMTAAEARWAKINQNLLREADEWGRDGKFDMFRNPLGEYLEALSKTSMPKKAWPLGDGGLNIGVIDVSTSRQMPVSPSWE